MNTSRILVPDDNFDGAAIRKALQILNHLSVENSGIRECILLIPIKGNLRHTTLEQVLGEKVSKDLAGGKTVMLGKCKLSLETERTYKNYAACDAVVVVYANQKLMDAVDSARGLHLIISVPEMEDSVSKWIKTWSPLIPGRETPQDEIVDNPIVRAALESITSRINLGNRILNPRDKEAVEDAFRILRANDQSTDSGNIRAWCIRNGWDPKGADEAEKYAVKAFGLKSKPSAFGSQWADDIYSKWVKKAQEKR